MNKISFQTQPSKSGAGEEVRILVDGRDLLELVRRIELPQATADGQPDLAASYEVLGPERWEQLTDLDDDNRVAVFGCNCGVVECWPLRVRITVKNGTVVWSDFEQPNRAWEYLRLGPFVFQREQYEQAVRSATRRTSR
jgi:hypothetical protein